MNEVKSFKKWSALIGCHPLPSAPSWLVSSDVGTPVVASLPVGDMETTYEEVRLNEVDIGDRTKWLKEGMDCTILFWKGKVIDFELPINVKLTVVEVDPGLKGDTAQGGSKPAIVDTGAVVSVPLFIDVGEVIVVDTRTGQYMSRA